MAMDTRSSLNRFNYLLGETEALYHEFSLRLGLSDSATKILYTLCDNGDCCLLQEICRRSGLSKQTANSALRKLETAGIVYLEAAGGRTKRVCLTGEGQALTRRTVQRIIGMENAVFAGWSPAEVQTYLALTERFLNDLRRQAGALDVSESREGDL